jgi:hypothetical protein
MRTLVLLSLSALALTGCDRGAATAADGSRTEAQQAAARDACLAEAMAAQAEQHLADLEEWGLAGGPGSAAAAAAGEFARAYFQHAQLRYATLAHADSALNHARTPADSARYVQTAGAFLPRGFEPGTLEGNVAEAWARDFSVLLANEDHRCHWDI